MIRVRLARLSLLATLLGFGTPAVADSHGTRDADRVRPAEHNPRYWQYRGRPLVLLGGSVEDNLFQIADLEAHLDLLARAGGNYVRNTTSARDPGNVQPFARTRDGRYDLGRWNEEYWRRFERLLGAAQRRDIIVQIEIWDRFDYAREQWDAQPFNPKNNVNYTYAQSGFRERYPEHPAKNRQPFFHTTPAQQNNQVVLRYQQRFVDELLRRSLPYPNVLYCISNETSDDEAWSAYWADYIRRRAFEAGRRVYLTEMWDDWDLRAQPHRRTLDRPERYDFVEISQNNHRRGEAHWRNLLWARGYVGARARPLNAVKVYGADTRANSTSLVGTWEWWRRLAGRPAPSNTPHDFGTAQEGLERWWRNLLGGAAAVRFHRPPAGLGLSREAQRHIRSARLFLADFDLLRAEPDADHALLSQRRENEAYLTRIADEAYAVYFPSGGAVRLELPADAEYTVTWLDIGQSRWGESVAAPNERPLGLRAPSKSHWLALVRLARLPERSRNSIDADRRPAPGSGTAPLR